MIGAMSAPLLDFLLGLEGLAAGTIVPGVNALVNIPRIEDGLNKLLTADMVTLFASLDEVVIRDFERLPDILELPRPFRRRIVWARAPFLGALGHLDGVFIIAHQELNCVAFHAAKSSLHICADLLERRSDVRTAIGIVDCRGDKESRLIVHYPLPRSRSAFHHPAGIAPFEIRGSTGDNSIDTMRPQRFIPPRPVQFTINRSRVSALRSEDVLYKPECGIPGHVCAVASGIGGWHRAGSEDDSSRTVPVLCFITRPNDARMLGPVCGAKVTSWLACATPLVPTDTRRWRHQSAYPVMPIAKNRLAGSGTGAGGLSCCACSGDVVGVELVVGGSANCASILASARAICG